MTQPLDERPEGYEETTDAFGIPFVGFPVQKRKRPKTGSRDHKPVWIEPDAKKGKYRVRVPNVRSWAVGVVDTLADVVQVESLPETRINPRETPPDVHVRPVVGGAPEAVMTLDERPSASSGMPARPFCRCIRSRPPPGTSGTPSRWSRRVGWRRISRAGRAADPLLQTLGAERSVSALFRIFSHCARTVRVFSGENSVSIA